MTTPTNTIVPTHRQHKPMITILCQPKNSAPLHAAVTKVATANINAENAVLSKNSAQSPLNPSYRRLEKIDPLDLVKNDK